MTLPTSVFIDGDEMLGLILYGLWAGASPPINASDLPELDPLGTSVRPFQLVGEGWSIRGLDVGFAAETSYRAAVEGWDGLLDTFLDRGASLAWLGSEGLPFADPPDLFTTEWMEDGVLAARSAEGLSFSGATPEGFVPLSNAQMGQLESVARATYEPGPGGTT
ncbi:hypothetical protein [Promicromonospora sukumoe]